MAEITQTSGKNGFGRRRFIKKRPTRIDMTPLVDLAFLLLTFFILTQTFNKPHVLEMAMPDRTGISAPVNADNVLNVVLSEDDRILWWMGLDPPLMVTSYSNEGIRKILLKKSRLNPSLVVLIKPENHSRFQNLVDILDEIDIAGLKRFAIVELTDDDERILSMR